MQTMVKLTMVKPVQLRKSDAGAIAASLASQWTRRLRELTMVKPVQLGEIAEPTPAPAPAQQVRRAKGRCSRC